MVGQEAVKLAVKGESGVMVTLKREKGDYYKCLPGFVDINLVANKEKSIPRSRAFLCMQ